MMSIMEYASDVNKSIEEIIKLCDKLDIKYTNEDSILEEEDIIELDNHIDEVVTNSVKENKEEEIINKANTLATNLTKEEKPRTKLKNKTKTVKNNTKEDFQKKRKDIYKHKEKLQSNEVSTDDNVIIYQENMTVGELAKEIGESATEIIKKLMSLGVMCNVNQSLDFDTCSILVSDYNKTMKKAETVDINDFENLEIEDAQEDLVPRAPIVTIMGHVDHGKTTLLDAIRNSSVASDEAGGITQAIGAYSVVAGGKKITFIDTPGHAAFTKMRARGASVTDIVVIIVAADDGVMPQTKEAIDHAKAAKVPIIVAINKIDKENANIDKVMTELADYGLVPEEWGGDIIVNKISAAKNEGIDKLLENILLIAEINEYKANPNRYATGVVIEAKKDKRTGTQVTVLVQNGTLRLGDPIVIGNNFGHVRTLKNDLGKNIVEAIPSTPVEVTGINEVPNAGDKFMTFETDKQAKAVALERKNRNSQEDTNKSGLSLDDLFAKIKEGIKEINVVLKTDVNGSMEAVKSALEKIEVPDVRINIIRAGVGAITQSDLVLAEASNAIIIGFNISVDNDIINEAKESNVDIREYDIIYKLVEDIEKAMNGLLEPVYKEEVTGTLEVRQIFKFSKVGIIAGCRVKDGTVKNNSHAKVIRDDNVIYTGKIKTLQHEKDQVKEMGKGNDCGVTLDNFQEIKELDIIEAYDLVEIKR